MILDAQLLLARRDGIGWKDFESALSAEAAKVRKLVGAKGDVRLAIRLEDDPSPGTVLGQRVTGSADNLYDGVIGVRSATMSSDDLIAALDGLGKRLAAVCDLAKSAALFADMREILPGDDALLQIYTLRRAPEMTHETFSEYWEMTHANHGRSTPGLHGYRQLHSDEALTKETARRAGVAIDDLDGLAEALYADEADFLTVMNTNVVREAGTDDLANFVYQPGSSVFLMRFVDF